MRRIQYYFREIAMSKFQKLYDKRRLELIDKKYRGGLTADEEKELNILEAEADKIVQSTLPDFPEEEPDGE